jgi:hypothetical protein
MRVIFDKGDKGSLGWTRMETQIMVEMPSILFIIKSKFDKILVVRLEGLFWARNKVGCSSLSLSLGLAFGGFTLCPAEDSNSYTP